jgi:hypothetical protein
MNTRTDINIKDSHTACYHYKQPPEHQSITALQLQGGGPGTEAFNYMLYMRPSRHSEVACPCVLCPQERGESYIQVTQRRQSTSVVLVSVCVSELPELKAPYWGCGGLHGW